MSAAPESSGHLQRLAEILAESTSGLPSTSVQHDSNPAGARLESVPLDRISRVTSELARGGGTDIDHVESLAMRQLLDDYTAAVGHIRAVTRLAEQRITEAAIPVHDAALYVRRAEKRGVAKRST